MNQKENNQKNNFDVLAFLKANASKTAEKLDVKIQYNKNDITAKFLKGFCEKVGVLNTPSLRFENVEKLKNVLAKIEKEKNIKITVG